VSRVDVATFARCPAANSGSATTREPGEARSGTATCRIIGLRALESCSMRMWRPRIQNSEPVGVLRVLVEGGTEPHCLVQ
jgi:hypothetical protein